MAVNILGSAIIGLMAGASDAHALFGQDDL
jgi:hypothetical protein